MSSYTNKAILARIEQRAKEKGISMRKLSLASGYGPDLIRDWKGPKSPQPRLDSLERVAHVLDVPAGWLAFGEDGPGVGIQRVPIISWVAAGHFSESLPFEQIEDAARIAVSGLKPGPHFALRLNGDSMDLVAPDKAIIIVDPTDRELVSRGYYVFRQGDDVTFKQYMTNPERLEPKSTNRNHEAMPLTADTVVVGRVDRAITDLL